MSEGRFSNLEFDDASAKADKPQERPAAAKLKDAAYYLKLAEKSELEGNKEEALRCFSAALGEDPLLIDAWIGQLTMLLSLKEYPETKVWADKALESFPDYPQVLAAKAVALFHMGHEKQARQMIDFAATGKGDFFIVWFCRGEMLLAQGLPAAESCLQAALRIAPRKDLASLRIGELLLTHGRYSKSMAMLQEAVKAQPRAAWGWYLLGRTQQKLGFSGEARVSFLQAKELVPFNKKYESALSERHGLSGIIKNIFRRIFA